MENGKMDCSSCFRTGIVKRCALRAWSSLARGLTRMYFPNTSLAPDEGAAMENEEAIFVEMIRLQISLGQNSKAFVQEISGMMFQWNI